METVSGQRTRAAGLQLALLIALAHAANDAFTNVLPVFLPILQERFGLGEAVLAAFVALISLSSNVLQAFVGWVGDRWCHKRAADLGLIVGSTLMSCLAVVPNVWSLFMLLALGGLGSAVFHPAAASLVHGTGPERRGLAMGLFTAGGPLGTALMPVVVLYVIRVFGTQYVPFLAVVGIAAGILLLLLAPADRRSPTRAAAKIFDRSVFFGPVGLLAVAGILRAIAFISFTNAIPLFMVNVRGFAADAAAIGWTLAAFSAASSVGTIFAGALEGRLGRVPLIVGSMLLSVPLLIFTLFLTPGSLPFYLVVALAGMTVNASIPLLVVSAQELAPHAIATASGLLMGFTWGVAGVLYIGFGALQEAMGLLPAMVLAFTFPVAAALLAGFAIRRFRPAAGQAGLRP